MYSETKETSGRGGKRLVLLIKHDATYQGFIINGRF